MASRMGSMAGFVMNLVTGLYFLVAQPWQYADNPAWWAKVAFLLIAGVNAAIFERVLTPRLRALGPGAVERVVETQGDIGPFRTLQKQPEWRGRPLHDQLRRFFGSGGRRKIRYARFLVEALELDRVPRPLDGVLRHV